VVPAVADLIAVIGCGNPARSDDGFGPEVVRRLAPYAGPGVVVRDAGTDGMAVMFAARGCTTLIVVDACMTGCAPGTLFELPAEAVRAPHRPGITLHDFRWDHALHAGRAMYGDAFPTDVTVLLVEVGSLTFGFGLSPAVEPAVDQAVARIAELLAARGVAARAEVP
jgi:hydrogenase maturation protease